MLGDRLSERLSFSELKLAAGVVLLSPFIPLLFMGEEYGEVAPFQYFISLSDPDLIEAVRQGRREEFRSFQWKGELPDPQDEATFLRSKLKQELCSKGEHRVLREFYKELIRLRKTVPALTQLSKEQMEVIGFEREKVLIIRRWKGNEEVIIIFNFDDSRRSIDLPIPAGNWGKQCDSEDESWGGKGSLIPELLSSEGQITLVLNSKAFSLFVRVGEG
jgi:maltooligosyltrehalose trehalohydrolase